LCVANVVLGKVNGKLLVAPTDVIVRTIDFTLLGITTGSLLKTADVLREVKAEW